jgi:hypothetical protein
VPQDRIRHFSFCILHFLSAFLCGAVAMSIGSLGIAGGLAGSPLAQTTGAAVDRAKQDTVHHQRQVDSTQQAADAAGIGQTHEEREASERDADGRMPWERQEATAEGEKGGGDAPDEQGEASNSSRPAGPPDPTGDAGGVLDLVG